MLRVQSPKRGRGRPTHPAREKVIDLALRSIEKGAPVNKAVRTAIDAVFYWGDVALDGSDPVVGNADLVLDKSEGADGNRLMARDAPRMRAAMAKWEDSERGEFDAPAWPEHVLDSKDTVVEQIAATIRRRRRRAAANT